MAAMAPRTLFSAVLALSTLLLTSAHPSYWITKGFSKSCTDHPVLGQRYKGHPNTVTDTSGLFSVSVGGSSVLKMCPGAQHTVEVSFGGNSRQGLLTASQGKFSVPYNSACPNRELLDNSPFTDYSVEPSYMTTFTLPCNAAGSVVLKVSATSTSYNSIQQSTATFVVDPSCAAIQCTATPTSSPMPPSPPVPPSPPPFPPSTNGSGGESEGEGEHEDEDEGEGGKRGGGQNGSHSSSLPTPTVTLAKPPAALKPPPRGVKSPPRAVQSPLRAVKSPPRGDKSSPRAVKSPPRGDTSPPSRRAPRKQFVV